MSIVYHRVLTLVKYLGMVESLVWHHIISIESEHGDVKEWKMQETIDCQPDSVAERVDGNFITSSTFDYTNVVNQVLNISIHDSICRDVLVG